MELPDCGEAPLQVGEDVVDVLCAHRQADGVGPDPLVLQLLWGQLAVGGGGRVDHQALGVGHIGQQGEQLQAVNEPVGLPDAAPDLKGQNGTAPLGKIALVQPVVRVLRQRRVIDPLHQRVPRQIFHHPPGILPVALQPQRQGLNPLQQQKGGKGGDLSLIHIWQALEAAIAAGVTVIPASGRPLTGLSPEFLDIPGVEYALTSNGAALYRLRDRQPTHTDYLDTGLAAELMDRLSSLELMATFFAAGRGYAVQRQLALLPRLSVSQAVKDYLATSRQPLEDPVDFIRQNGRVEKFSLNFIHTPGGTWVDYPQVQALLEEHPGLSVVSGGTDNLEITAPTASKGTALLALADHLGIPHEQTMACGDSENDLEMLKAAGFAVAMANSEACILPYADAVTASNEEDGVAKAIAQYIL